VALIALLRLDVAATQDAFRQEDVDVALDIERHAGRDVSWIDRDKQAYRDGKSSAEVSTCELNREASGALGAAEAAICTTTLSKSELGQTEKHSTRADVFRSSPKNRRWSADNEFRRGPFWPPPVWITDHV